MNKEYVIVLGFLFLLVTPFISSSEFGYDNPTLPKLVSELSTSTSTTSNITTTNNITTYINSTYWNLSGTSLFPQNLGYNVGIGTNNPLYKLDVNGTSNFADQMLITRSASAQSTGTIKLTAGSSSGDDTAGFGLFSRASGANAGARNWLFNANLANFGNFDIYRSTTSSGNPDTHVLSINSNGLVGIGTTTPAQTLNVVGNGNITGNFYANNTLTVTNNQVRINRGTDGQVGGYTPTGLWVNNSIASGVPFAVTSGAVGWYWQFAGDGRSTLRNYDENADIKVLSTRGGFSSSVAIGDCTTVASGGGDTGCARFDALGNVLGGATFGSGHPSSQNMFIATHNTPFGLSSVADGSRNFTDIFTYHTINGNLFSPVVRPSIRYSAFNHVFTVDNSSGSNTYGTYAMSINGTTGNVMIGTATNASDRLTISGGDVRIMDTNYLELGDGSVALRSSRATNGDMELYAGNTLQMILNSSSGNVETITNVVPQTDINKNIGATNKRYNNMYTQFLFATGLRADAYNDAANGVSILVHSGTTNSFYDGAGVVTMQMIPDRLTRFLGNVNLTNELYVKNGTAVSPWLYNQTSGIMNIGLLNKTTRTNVTVEADGTYTQLIWTAQTAGMYRLSTYLVTTDDNVLDGSVATTFYWDDETQTQNFAVPTAISLTTVGSVAYADNTFYVQNGGQINVSRTVTGTVAGLAKYSMYNTVERVS